VEDAVFTIYILGEIAIITIKSGKILAVMETISQFSRNSLDAYRIIFSTALTACCG
jgi:hypothetical protein